MRTNSTSSISSLRLTLAAIAALLWTPALSSLAAVQSEGFFRGDGTVYTLSDPQHGNCNFMAYPNAAATKYAALNSQQWDATKNCGRCAEVTCTDSRCAGATKASEVVHIVDQCPECAAGDLDLSPTVFRAITGFESDRLQIKWQFVDCPVVTSKITYCLKKGSNEFWAAIQPTNFVAGVASVKVNGQTTTMVDSAYYFLLDGKSTTKVDLSKVTITVFGLNGEVIEDTVSFASSDCVEGGKQFTPGKGGQAQQSPGPIVTSTPTVTPSPAPAPIASSVTPAPQAQGAVQFSATPSPVTTQLPAPWTQGTASPSRGPTRATATPSTAASSTTENEVAGEADHAADWDDESESTTTHQQPATTRAPASDGDAKTDAATSPPSTSDNTKIIKTETEAGDHATSPTVIVLSAFGCLGAVVLVVLAAYVNKKKLDDKRADRADEGSFGSDHLLLNPHALALTSQNSSAPSGSFCQVLTPSGERRSTNFAVL